MHLSSVLMAPARHMYVRLGETERERNVTFRKKNTFTHVTSVRRFTPTSTYVDMVNRSTLSLIVQ